MKRLLYTPGEPCGIGPDLAILHSVNSSYNKQPYELIVISDPDLLQHRAKKLNLNIQLKETSLEAPATPTKSGQLAFIPINIPQINTEKPDSKNASAILTSLDIAITACQQQQAHAMVTGPIQKSIINEASIPFSGHTEYLAEKTNTERVVMLLATQGLKVALATTHLPLKDVPAAITKESLKKTVRILYKDLQQKFNIAQPKILVCGLNPHAGEDGHLGTEEIDIIIPALQELAKERITTIGPLPADTLFTENHLATADAVLAMYHDQGLPVLKYKGFGAAANITLGLPIIRTSVDHGTALDLAGTSKIDSGSLNTAIQYAINMQTPEIVA